MITMYFDQPDYAGHVYGPDSSQASFDLHWILDKSELYAYV